MPPNDEATLWHFMGRIEEGQGISLSEWAVWSSRRASAWTSLKTANQRMDLFEKRIERLLYAGLAIGVAILAAVVVGQIFG